MLQQTEGLSRAQLDAIAELERRTTDVDGGRLKLAWSTLDHRSGDRVDDLLWWDGDQLRGFVGLYSFGGGPLELAGMVDPVARRRGIGTVLVDAALALVAARGRDHALLVCPGATDTGAAFARRRGGVLDHAEHVLVLDGEPSPGSPDTATTVRPADDADTDDIRRLLELGFGPQDADLGATMAADRGQHLVAQRGDAVVGYLRLALEDGIGSVSGLVVDPPWRGRGIGRDVLRRCCTLLREQGASEISLEVEVDNDRALGLYTSLGFRPHSTEYYFRLPIASWPTLGRPRG